MSFLEDAEKVMAEDGPVSHPAWIEYAVPLGIFLLKNFSALMKESEKNSSSFKKVLIQCLEKLQNVPQKIHWRAYLDLADFAKRESKFEEARNLFHIVSIIQPYAY